MPAMGRAAKIWVSYPVGSDTSTRLTLFPALPGVRSPLHNGRFQDRRMAPVTTDSGRKQTLAPYVRYGWKAAAAVRPRGPSSPMVQPLLLLSSLTSSRPTQIVAVSAKVIGFHPNAAKRPCDSFAIFGVILGRAMLVTFT